MEDLIQKLLARISEGLQYDTISGGTANELLLLINEMQALNIANVSKPKADCFGKSDLQHVYEDVDTSFKNFEDWYADYLLPI